MCQSAAPTSFRLLYDEKRDKKETKYGSEILCVNNFFYFVFLIFLPSGKQLLSCFRISSKRLNVEVTNLSYKFGTPSEVS